MKNNNSKSFSFKVAKSAEQNRTPSKARDGVALAGCTMAQTPWGSEPRGPAWMNGARDQGYWC